MSIIFHFLRFKYFMSSFFGFGITLHLFYFNFLRSFARFRSELFVVKHIFYISLNPSAHVTRNV